MLARIHADYSHAMNYRQGAGMSRGRNCGRSERAGVGFGHWELEVVREERNRRRDTGKATDGRVAILERNGRQVWMPSCRVSTHIT